MGLPFQRRRASCLPPLDWRKVGPAYWQRYQALLSQPATRTTDSLSTPSGTWPTGNSYRAAITLTDGRVFCVPHGTTAARVYDPATGTTTVLSYTYPGGFANWMACLLRDGRVFMPACNITSSRLWDGGFGVTLSDAWLLSTYTNVSP